MQALQRQSARSRPRGRIHLLSSRAPRGAMPPTNYLLIYSGTYTLVQALFQFMFSVVAIGQYFCVVDFLRTYPLLIYIRILYFHNPSRCGSDINVGGSIDGVADQAFVYLSSTPLVATRALIFTSIGGILCVFWVVGSIILIKGGRLKHHSNHAHWPWIVVTFLMSLLDMVGILAYGNDTFHTRTLNDLLEYINGVGSGFGNANPDTVWASWAMVILHSRFGVFLLLNMALVVSGILDCTRLRSSVTSSDSSRARNEYETSPESSSKAEEGSDEATSSSPSEPIPKIPRPGLSQSFRNMKDLIFGRSASPNSLHDARTRNRVNFLQGETTSDPIQSTQTFENMIAEQQRRLRGSTVDTSGRRSPAHAIRSLPQLHNIQESVRGLRSGAGQLPSQMPWAYIAGAPTNRMRDQLPPDEDLPPVPLPDYTAFQSHRKASVHRAASSLSSLTQKKDYTNSKSSHPGSHVDVLY